MIVYLLCRQHISYHAKTNMCKWCGCMATRTTMASPLMVTHTPALKVSKSANLVHNLYNIL